MSIANPQWESRLLEMAYQGLDSRHAAPTVRFAQVEMLTHAYGLCDNLTRQHSKTFYLASSLMPFEKRRAIRALYAFCRISDDLVDRAGSDPRASLENWREQALVSHPESLAAEGDARFVAAAWYDARHRYHIPRLFAQQLIDGVAQDLSPVRYQSFPDLAAYCYGVASTVGLMSMHITGYAGRTAIPYAVRLGVALQLTNILRDVGEDWRTGRLYLPLDELHAFGLHEADIARGLVTPRWRAFMRFQIERTRDLYHHSLPGVNLLDADGRLAVAAAGELYRNILADIEAHDYDVFTRRAHLTKWDKLRHLPGIWWRATRQGY